MQVPDPADPRPAYVKIASSIRAAILNGELEPGAALQTGHELAQYFDVSRMTVVAALRELREEGYVHGRPGGKTYVRDQAALPVPNRNHPLMGTADYLFEIGTLKTLPRAGWLRVGIKNPESVADHSLRVAVIGLVLAALEGADPGRTAALCVLHDSPETRTGDITAVGRAYVTTWRPEAVAAAQTGGLPVDAAKRIQAYITEYEEAETPEARIAKDADKLESLLQAVEYRAQGYDTEAWIETSITSLRTDAGKQLAQAINASDPAHWWKAFGDSYAELREGSKGRAQPE